MPFDLEAFKEALQVQVDFQTPQQEEVSITVENLLSRLHEELPEDEEGNGPKKFMEDLLGAVDALSQLAEETGLDSVDEQAGVLSGLLSEETSRSQQNYFQKNICGYFKEDSTEYAALLQFQTTVLNLFDEEAQLTRQSTASLVQSNIHEDSDAEETLPADRLRLNLARTVLADTPRTNVSGDDSQRDDLSTDRSDPFSGGGANGLRLTVTGNKKPRPDQPPTPKTRQPIGTFTPGFVGRLAKVAGKTTPSRTIANQGDFEALIGKERDKVNTMRALDVKINQPGADIGTIAKQHLADKDSVKQKSNPLKYEDDVRIKHKINTEVGVSDP